MEDPKEEYFEDQIEQIDDLSSDTLDVQSEPEQGGPSEDEPKKPKLTRKETKAAIIGAIKKKDISKRQGDQLLWHLGFVTSQTSKKVVARPTRVKKRKQQKMARKANRK